MAQTRYWRDGYWKPSHWHADYWRDATYGGTLGNYWRGQYWRPNFWRPNYWAISSGSNARQGVFTTSTTVTATLRGTFAQSIARTGALNTTTVTLGTFGGSVYQVQYVEWSLFIGPTWSFFDIPAFNGASNTTLAPLTGTLRGFTVPPDSFIGRHQSALANVTGAFTGTFLAAPARSGRMTDVLANYPGTFRGSFVGVLTNEGELVTTLADVTGSFSGTHVIRNATGTLAGTLEPFGANWFGSATPPGAILGRLVVTIPIGTMVAYGNFTRSENIHDADLTLLPLAGRLELLPLCSTLEWTLRE